MTAAATATILLAATDGGNELTVMRTVVQTMTMRITTSIVIVAACLSFIALLWAPELGLTWLVVR
jgi:hypothetical protein